MNSLLPAGVGELVLQRLELESGLVGRFRFRLGCPVGSVSVVEFGAHGPLLHALADRSHLDETLRGLPGT